MKETIFAISDIHGRKVTLEDFESKGFDRENPSHKIVCIGDYFDRGTQNMEILEFCEHAKDELGTDRFITIYGNHDEMMMTFLEDLKAYDLGMYLKDIRETSERWFRNGGQETLDELFGDLDSVYDQEMANCAKRMQAFCDGLLPYYENEDYIFVHAAIDASRDIDTWDRTFIHEGFKTDKTVVIGHTTHEYLDEETFLTTLEVGVIAQSTKDPLCLVYNIDNGKGNNIVRLDAK